MITILVQAFLQYTCWLLSYRLAFFLFACLLYGFSIYKLSSICLLAFLLNCILYFLHFNFLLPYVQAFLQIAFLLPFFAACFNAFRFLAFLFMFGAIYRFAQSIEFATQSRNSYARTLHCCAFHRMNTEYPELVYRKYGGQ